MELEAKYTVVGAIVIALVTCLSLFLLWLSKSTSKEQTKTYWIYFKQQTLAGLQEDSAVTMKGIKVGIVENLDILQDDIERVRVEIRVDSGTPIKTDTEAVIQRNLLTGLATIDLAGSTQGASYLTTIQEGERYPVIPEGESSLAALQKTLPEVLNNTAEVMHRASLVLSDENRAAFSRTFNNLETISARLAKGEGEFADTVQNINALVHDLRGFIEQVATGSRSLEASLQNTSETLAREISTAARSLTTLGNALQGTARELQNPKKLLFGPQVSALGPGEGG